MWSSAFVFFFCEKTICFIKKLTSNQFFKNTCLNSWEKYKCGKENHISDYFKKLLWVNFQKIEL